MCSPKNTCTRVSYRPVSVMASPPLAGKYSAVEERSPTLPRDTVARPVWVENAQGTSAHERHSQGVLLSLVSIFYILSTPNNNIKLSRVCSSQHYELFCRVSVPRSFQLPHITQNGKLPWQPGKQTAPRAQLVHLIRAAAHPGAPKLVFLHHPLRRRRASLPFQQQSLNRIFSHSHSQTFNIL